MRDAVCVIDVGVHPPPFWINARNGLGPVCSRHRAQYEERADEFGPFDWRPFPEPDTPPLICPCGEPVSAEYDARVINEMVGKFGPSKDVHVLEAGRTWSVPTIHILVHGIAGKTLCDCGFDEVLHDPGPLTPQKLFDYMTDATYHAHVHTAGPLIWWALHFGAAL